MKTWLFIFLTSTVITFSSVKGNHFFFEQVSPESGFAFDGIYTIAEDCNGFAWFGSNNGLYYYNTKTVEKIDLGTNPNGSIQPVKINKIYKDDNCLLWICTELGLYTLINNSSEIIKINLDYFDSSYPPVKDIVQWDSEIYIILIEGSLYQYNSITTSLIELTNSGSDTRQNINYVDKDHKGKLLIGTIDGRVYLSSANNYSDYTLFFEGPASPVRTICIDTDRYLIGFDGGGVTIVDLNGKILETYREEYTGLNNIPDNRVRKIIKRPNGEIWVGTYNGISVFSADKNTVIKSNGLNGLPYSSIYDLHQGINDGIWVGTWAGGLAYYSDYNYRFHHIKSASNEKEFPRSIISSFTEDTKQNIWIGREEAGVNVFDPVSHKFVDLLQGQHEDNISRIKSIARDDDGNIWIGTVNKGLWLYNYQTEVLKKIENELLTPDDIYSSLTPINDNIWIGTRNNGLKLYNKKTSEFKEYNLEDLFPESSDANRIWKIFGDSKNNIWVCTDNGLFMKSSITTQWEKCFQNDSFFGLSKNIIYTIFEDNNGVLWIGTKGKGMYTYHPELKLLQPFNHNDIIYNADIYGILMDDKHNIWFSTNRGIYLYKIKPDEIHSFSMNDGLSGDQFIPNAAFRASDGILYFGSPNGFSIINPQIIKMNPLPPEVSLSEIMVNNSAYETSTGIKAKPYQLSGIEELILKHNQNSLSFGFCSNSHIKTDRNRFKYRLAGYMDEWTITDHDRNATFTKIPPGKYTLEVLGSNHNGVWSTNPTLLPIIIRSPVWLAWYSYLFYFAVSAIIIYLVLRELNLRLRLRRAIISEKYKNEANQMLYDEKIKFFTNVSHEFRTPLTLIISPVNSLLQKFKYDQSTSNQLSIIKRNTDRLLRLTKQILDFRMIEVGKLKPRYNKSDIVAISTSVIDCFEFQIIEKKINLVFSSDYKTFKISTDQEMVEKILNNLLSNAFKFSSEKSQILFSIEKKVLTSESYHKLLCAGDQFYGEALEIKIRDFGKGIPEDMLNSIFDRFTKASNNNKIGSGIGLHMCLEYAKLINANLLVSSELGKGSTFILNIPVEKIKSMKKEAVIIQPHYDKIQDENFPDENKPDEAQNGAQVVLIAEDNNDLRLYLKDYLSKYFKVLTAKNGTQAFEIALEVIPDIIITDILMPGMGGLELIQAIKNNHQTRSVPVIILTALSEDIYQMQGLVKGADSFLVKPIDEEMLKAQINNLLKSRESLKNKFDQEHDYNSTTSLTKLSKSSFIEIAKEIVVNNLQKPEFGIPELAEQLNVSHSSLHRKIKRAVNLSPSEFIRDIRLNNAIILMKDNNYNINEISYYVGFNSTSYFMRSFKRKYGKTPKEYRKNINLKVSGVD